MGRSEPLSERLHGAEGYAKPDEGVPIHVFQRYRPLHDSVSKDLAGGRRTAMCEGGALEDAVSWVRVYRAR